jgi:23S rRNA (adenine1618-N6)-methyltransferase
MVHISSNLCSGTGASAIYPLIACSLSPNWQFVATGWSPHALDHLSLTRMLDIDAVSLSAAQSNVDRNDLSGRITLIRADPTGPILLPLVQDTATSCVMRGMKSIKNLLWT